MAGLLRGLERSWPAAVGFDDFVNLGHDADGLAEGDDDFLVVGNIVVGKYPSWIAFLWPPVLEPLLADLVAADIEVPYLLRHAPKATRFCLVDPHNLLGVGDLFDLEVAGADEGSDLVAELGRLHKVESDEFPSQFDKRAKQA